MKESSDLLIDFSSEMKGSESKSKDILILKDPPIIQNLLRQYSWRYVVRGQNDHDLNHHDQSFYLSCSFCFISFITDSDYEAHMENFHSYYECSFCNLSQSFNDKTLYESHLLSIHSEYFFSEKNERENKEEKIERYSKTQHKGESKSKGFKVSEEVDEKNEREKDEYDDEDEEEEEFKCLKCNKHYVSQRILERHYKEVHKMTSPSFGRQNTPFRTTSSSTLPPPPLPKTNIPKTFFKEPFSEVDDTFRSLSQSSIFPCPQCKANFKTPSLLGEHLLNFHGCKVSSGGNSLESNTPGISCSFCGKILNNDVMYQNHLKRLHNKELLSSSISPSSLSSLKCPYCDKIPKDRKMYFQHLKRVHHVRNREKLSSDDSKVSSNSEALRTHSSHFHKVKFKPYMCSECKARFFDVSFLRTHIKTSHFGLSVKMCKIIPSKKSKTKEKEKEEVHFRGFEKCEVLEAEARRKTLRKILHSFPTAKLLKLGFAF